MPLPNTSGMVLAALAAFAIGAPQSGMTDGLTEALAGGKASGDFRLRYEDVKQDNAVRDASALTLGSRLAYTTASLNGFSALLEMEDVRIVAGQDSYSVPPTGFKAGEHSVVADPEVTEVDQGFVQYKQSKLTAKVGRQVVAYDGHRFIGHVGWRQDRQTFDAARVDFSPVQGLALSYSYIDQRNGIFAEAADQEAKDHLLNASMETPIGRVVAYSYLLENDNGTDNSLDTLGVSLTGSAPLASANVLYSLEFASQDAKAGTLQRDADYSLIELGFSASGLTVKVGVERLGSDDGAYGFATPLATLHKFNGWADIFLNTPATGLIDGYGFLGGSIFGGKWAIAYHEFSADEDTPTLDEYGTELDLSYARKFGSNYNAGIKYASYNAKDFAVDTEKLWAWVGLTF